MFLINKKSIQYIFNKVCLIFCGGSLTKIKSVTLKVVKNDQININFSSKMLSPDAIIMDKVTTLVLSENGTVSDFVKAMIPKIPVIIFMVAVKKCIENSSGFFSTIWNGIKTIVHKICYSELTLHHYTKADNIFYYYNNAYRKKINIFHNQYFPMSVQKNQEEDYLSVFYMNWYPKHKKLLLECENEAKKEYHEYQEAITQVKIIYKKLTFQDGGLKYVDSKSSRLYPSKNYVNLINIIRTHVKVSKIVESYSVLGVLIDGVPGLGKTKFSDFAVNEKLVGCFYKVDMTNMLKFSFTNVLHLMYHQVQITTDTIFMIDEIDKYINYRIDIEYADELQSISNKNKKNDQAVVLNKDDFYNQTKTTFLYDMLSILERDGLEYPVIVIFCSNNFKSVFEGVDLTHHKSLYSRFMKVKFYECDHHEIIDYIVYYNDIFVNSDYELELDVKKMKKLLKPDVHVTHRTLHHISVTCKYNAYHMIDMLNNYVSEDDSGEALENKINNAKKTIPNINNDNCSDTVNSNKNIIIPSIMNDIKEDNSDKIVVNTIIKNAKSTDTEGINEYNSDKIVVDTIIKNAESDTEESIDDKILTTHVDNDSLEKIERQNYIKTLSSLEVGDHDLLWNNSYIAKNITNRKEIVDTIKNFLNENEKSRDSVIKQKLIIAEIFDYLSVEGYKIMDHPAFKKTIKVKIYEFYIGYPDVFTLLKPSTKEFIYAASGIRC